MTFETPRKLREALQHLAHSHLREENRVKKNDPNGYQAHCDKIKGILEANLFLLTPNPFNMKKGLCLHYRKDGCERVTTCDYPHGQALVDALEKIQPLKKLNERRMVYRDKILTTLPLPYKAQLLPPTAQSPSPAASAPSIGDWWYQKPVETTTHPSLKICAQPHSIKPTLAEQEDLEILQELNPIYPPKSLDLDWFEAPTRPQTPISDPANPFDALRDKS